MDYAERTIRGLRGLRGFLFDLVEPIAAAGGYAQ
jgi:hypothetical protein